MWRSRGPYTNLLPLLKRYFPDMVSNTGPEDQLNRALFRVKLIELILIESFCKAIKCHSDQPSYMYDSGVY